MAERHARVWNSSTRKEKGSSNLPLCGVVLPEYPEMPESAEFPLLGEDEEFFLWNIFRNQERKRFVRDPLVFIAKS